MEPVVDWIRCPETGAAGYRAGRLSLASTDFVYLRAQSISRVTATGSASLQFRATREG
jgi:hypothetical protein